MNAFKAFRIHEREGRIAAGFEQVNIDALTAGNVVIRVQYSSINYKDALAATGAGKILRKYPLNGGIDLSGEVVSSTDARYKPGQKVLVTGCGHSETLDGGYAEYVRAQGDSVIPLPDGLSLFDAMALGTAGFTTGLAIHRMEQNGQKPSMGPIVVTGASGGVGSIAVDLFSKLGYEVVAVSGKPEADALLKSLGAAKILRRQDIDLGKRRDPDLAHAHGRQLGQHCEHRPRREPQARDDGDALHPARREPARHQFLGHAARRAHAHLEAARDGPEAAAPRQARDPNHRLRRAAVGLRRLPEEPDPGPHGRQDRLTWMLLPRRGWRRAFAGSASSSRRRRWQRSGRSSTSSRTGTRA
jgi:hypothetical protein